MPKTKAEAETKDNKKAKTVEAAPSNDKKEENGGTLQAIGMGLKGAVSSVANAFISLLSGTITESETGAETKDNKVLDSYEKAKNGMENSIDEIRKQLIGDDALIKDKKLKELAKLAVDKYDMLTSTAFEGTIEGVQNKLNEITKTMQEGNQKTFSDFVLNEIDTFQSKTKPEYIEKIGGIRKELKKQEDDLASFKEQLSKAKKAEDENAKTVGKKIKRLFGHGKSADEKQALEDIEQAKSLIRRSHRELSHMESNLESMARISKNAKEYQRTTFNVITKKSILNALYNPKKGTGVFGCLSQVIDFIGTEIQKPKCKPSSSEIAKMKKLLEDSERKHFEACKSKLEEFAQIEIPKPKQSETELIKSLKDLKNEYTENTRTIFKDFESFINDKKPTSAEPTSEDYRRAAKDILNEKKAIIDKVEKLKSDFYDKFAAKMKEAGYDENKSPSTSVASIILFNCSSKIKYQYMDILVRRQLVYRPQGSLPAVSFTLLTFSAYCFQTVISSAIVSTLAAMFPPAVVGTLLGAALSILAIKIYNTIKTEDDLDAIIAKLKEAKKSSS